MQKVGALLQVIVKKVFLQLGASKVWIPFGQSNGVDLKVWDKHDNLVIVGEILNWSVKSKLPLNRRNHMISNLKQYKCNKIVIYTTLDKTHLKVFSSNGISHITIGYQILPQSFYRFYCSRNQIIKRKPYTLAVQQDIETKIKNHLKRRRISI